LNQLKYDLVLLAIRLGFLLTGRFKRGAVDDSNTFLDKNTLVYLFGNANAKGRKMFS